MIDAGEPGCDVDPDVISACFTHRGMVVLRNAYANCRAFRRDALISCGDTPPEGPTL